MLVHGYCTAEPGPFTRTDFTNVRSVCHSGLFAVVGGDLIFVIIQTSGVVAHVNTLTGCGVRRLPRQPQDGRVRKDVA